MQTPFQRTETLSTKWKNIVFGRVTRVVARAHDLSLWLNDAAKGTRKYLGDNSAILNQYTPEERARSITWEYDYYYGFCTPLPYFSEIATSSIHFISQNASKIDLIQNATADWIDDYSVIPPKEGALVCGIFKETKKGASFGRWWPCPLAFWELWKLIMSNRHYSPLDYDMNRLYCSSCAPAERRVYQAMAARFVFKRPIPQTILHSIPKIGDDRRPFIDCFEKSGV